MAEKMVKWVKPCGLKVETNSDQGTIEAAVGLGWKSEAQIEEEAETEKTVAKPAVKTATETAAKPAVKPVNK